MWIKIGGRQVCHVLYLRDKVSI